MKKKVLMVLVLAALVASSPLVTGAFAQRVGDTVTVSGQNYVIERIDGTRLTLNLEPTIEGTWVNERGDIVYTISGDTGVYTQLNNNLTGYMLEAKEKGLIKVGDLCIRNIRKTGALTWTAQYNMIMHNTSTRSNPTHLQWYNETYTLSADGRTISDDGGRTVWLTRR